MHKSVSQRSSASKLRYVRIVLEHGAERAFQRVQPGLVIPPVIDSLAIDRLAHLLRAGGAHGALVLVEPQTALVERQAAIVEQAPDFALGVRDHALIDHAMHAA